MIIYHINSYNMNSDDQKKNVIKSQTLHLSRDLTNLSQAKLRKAQLGWAKLSNQMYSNLT